MRDPQAMNAERKYSQLEQQLSQMRGQRRSSVAVVPATPLVGAYSASNSKYRSIFMSSSKYAPSPPNAVSAWRSRFPTVAPSTRQQVRLVRSPANGNGSTPEGGASSSRYCFSMQKRVQVDSLRHQPLRVPQVLTGAGVYGLPLRDNVNGARFAAPQAKRDLCNNPKRRILINGNMISGELSPKLQELAVISEVIEQDDFKMSEKRYSRNGTIKRQLQSLTARKAAESTNRDTSAAFPDPSPSSSPSELPPPGAPPPVWQSPSKRSIHIPLILGLAIAGVFIGALLALYMSLGLKFIIQEWRRAEKALGRGV